MSAYIHERIRSSKTIPKPDYTGNIMIKGELTKDELMQNIKETLERVGKR
jgi:hypothetical protein